MVKVEQGRYVFYTCKVTYDIKNSDNKEEHIEVYTDNPSMYTSMGNSVKNLNIENFTPSEHEKYRLEEINSITAEISETNIGDINLFIEHSAINPTTRFTDLKKLEEKYSSSTKNYYLDLAKKQLASARYFVEVGGIDYNDYRVATDRDTRTSIYNIIDDFELGAIDSIEYKTLDGQYVTFDFDTFKDMAREIAIHKHNCFKAEGNITKYLESLSAAELQKFRPEKQRDMGMNPDDTEENTSLEYLFDIEYSNLQGF